MYRETVLMCVCSSLYMWKLIGSWIERMRYRYGVYCDVEGMRGYGNNEISMGLLCLRPNWGNVISHNITIERTRHWSSMGSWCWDKWFHYIAWFRLWCTHSRAAGPYEVNSGADHGTGVNQQTVEGGGGKVERATGSGWEGVEHAEVKGQQVRVSGQQHLPQPLQAIQWLGRHGN